MIELIKKYEGFRSRAYKCPAGILTIGYGSTKHMNGDPINEDDIVTEDQAKNMLLDYLVKNVYWIYTKIPYTLSFDQKRAIASLVYNVGPNAFMKSKLYKAICNKNYYDICREWDFGFKQNLKGLYKRRTEELYLFIKDI